MFELDFHEHLVQSLWHNYFFEQDVRTRLSRTIWRENSTVLTKRLEISEHRSIKASVEQMTTTTRYLYPSALTMRVFRTTESRCSKEHVGWNESLQETSNSTKITLILWMTSSVRDLLERCQNIELPPSQVNCGIYLIMVSTILRNKIRVVFDCSARFGGTSLKRSITPGAGPDELPY